jgi:hypothetical protein
MDRDSSQKSANAASGLQPPLTIGWKEYIDFDDWGFRRIKAKIDTGARTSALDVAGYTLVQVDGVGLIAELRLALNRKHPERIKVIQAPVLRLVAVRNTSGIYEDRPLVETTLRLGPIFKRVQLTVANRASMCCAVILGRKALEGDFLVDVAQKFLLRRMNGEEPPTKN